MSSAQDHANEIRGYKSTLSNANTSDEAKQHAREMIQKLDPTGVYERDEPDTLNQIRGYRAALSNASTSAEAKAHAHEMLAKLEPQPEEENQAASTEHHKNPGNVVGGLKAAISNPNVSEEKKDEAQARLDSI